MERSRQFLIFDADDTLWENNIYFEEAFDRFYEYLSHSSMSSSEVRRVLDEIELTNTKTHGYGSKNYARNLEQCYRRLSEHQIAETDLKAVQDFAHQILERPIELIEGVADTIARLSERHSLTIFTKGDMDEQRVKIDRSGLRGYFEYAAIVREKNQAAYSKLAEERNFEHEKTWMIGNSPKSDINPALAARLNAVFVPHARTWSLEHATVPESHPRLICVGRIRELLDHF